MNLDLSCSFVVPGYAPSPQGCRLIGRLLQPLPQGPDGAAAAAGPALRPQGQRLIGRRPTHHAKEAWPQEKCRGTGNAVHG